MSQFHSHFAIHISRRKLLKTAAAAVAAAAATGVWTPESAQAASMINLHKSTPTTGSGVWKKIPNPTNPGSYLTSYSAAGQLDGTQSTGTGSRSAVWVMSGLQAGYYKVEMFYPKHAKNCAKVLVQWKTLGDADYKDFPQTTILNQRIGDGNSVINSTYTKTTTNMTPFKSSNALSYIWVNLNSTGAPGTGVLGIRISDARDKPASGLMIADSIKLTLMGTVK